MKVRIAILCAMAFAQLAFGLAGERSFKVTLLVVDDEGTPVPGANARVSYEKIHATKESERVGASKGTTDASGKVTLEGTTGEASIGYDAKMSGYYQTWGLRYNFAGTRVFRWQPWNPTIEVVLKRIKNPVPMYAKQVAEEVPVKDADVGYDLVVGDWVSPHGKGKLADMVFHGSGEVLGDRNYRGELTVTFPGQGNGLIALEVPQPQPSPLRMPYEAPGEGYESKRVWRSVRKYDPVTMRNEEYINDSSKTQNFFIRVRSELDVDGKVTKAMYGKIHAPFDFDARGREPSGRTRRQWVSFEYYLNPDGTRNIEFDPKRNLLNPTGKDRPGYQVPMP